MRPALRPGRELWEESFESVLKGGGEKPVSPGYCNAPLGQSPVPLRVRLGPDGTGPAGSKSGDTLQGGVRFPSDSLGCVQPPPGSDGKWFAGWDSCGPQRSGVR